MDQEYIRDEKEQERRKLVRLEMKRKRARQQRIVLGALVLVVALVIVLIARGCSARKAQREVEEAMEAANAAVEAEARNIKATIAAVGDIMCYEEQMLDAQQEDGTYDFAPSFAAVKPYLESANITVGNLELNFCGPDSGYKGFPSFNAPEALAATLKEAGFDILQTANTYSIQNGLNGLTSTIRYLTEQQIDHLGTYHSAESKAENHGVILKNVNGIRFAFLGYTKGMNNMALPEDAQYCVDVLYKDYSSNYSEINTPALLASVKAAKELKADVIIAMLHWGNEYELQPGESQMKIADLLFENGVDVILGSHSHEVGPMEKRTVTVDGEEKEVFLAYSLGNFYSAMTDGTAQTSAILNLEFTMDAETGITKISDANYTPLYIVDKGEEADVRYEVLPIRGALSSSAFSQYDETFTAALETLKTNTGSNLDSGN